jgi:fermentation-respiration switch protein FrsA (DUF1100 family)
MHTNTPDRDETANSLLLLLMRRRAGVLAHPVLLWLGGAVPHFSVGGLELLATPATGVRAELFAHEDDRHALSVSLPSEVRCASRSAEEHTSRVGRGSKSLGHSPHCELHQSLPKHVDMIEMKSSDHKMLDSILETQR